jgi:hypothetical protein
MAAPSTEVVESVLFDELSPTDIPIIFGSYAVLQEICEEQFEREALWDRRTVLEDAPGDRLSPTEAAVGLEDNSLQLSSGRLDQCKVVDFALADRNLNGPQDEHIQFETQVDVDSIDVLFKPLGGAAFGYAAATISLQWDGSFVQESTRLGSRNCLERAPAELLDPDEPFGRYFVSRAAAHRGALSRPVAIRIGDVHSVALKQTLPLHIIFPSKVMERISGDELLPLRRMFTALSRNNSVTASNLAAPTSVLWYLYTECLLMCANRTTSVGKSSAGCTRMACCACPNKNSSCRNSRQRLFLSEGDLSLAAAYMVRFVAALEVESDVPEGIQVLSASHGDNAYDLDTGLVGRVEETVLDDGVRACLIAPLANMDLHLEHFRSTVWGPDVQTSPFGHGDIDFRSCTGDVFGGEPNPLKRLGNMAHPCAVTSALQETRNCFSVHDFLLLSPVILRMTCHGMKFVLTTPGDVARFQKSLATEISAERCMDMTVDVGFSFGIPTAGVKAQLTTEAAQAGVFALPNSSRQKRRVEKGLSRFAGPQFPHAAGLGSQKTAVGSFGSRESMTIVTTDGAVLCNIRRTKVYSTDFHYSMRGGKTEYAHAQRDVSTVLHAPVPETLARWSQKGWDGLSRSQKKSIEQADVKFDKAMEGLVHDNLRRKVALLSSKQLKSSMRVEVTYGVGDEGLHDCVALEHAWRVLSLSKATNIPESVANDMPWWMRCPVYHAPGKAVILSISSPHELGCFSLALEAHLLQKVIMGRDVCRKIARGARSEEGVGASVDPFLKFLLRSSIPKGVASEIVLACCRGWYSGAKLQVLSRIFDKASLAMVPLPTSPTFDLSLTGAELSLIVCGLPIVHAEALAVTYPVLREIHSAFDMPPTQMSLPACLKVKRIARLRTGGREAFGLGPKLARFNRSSVHWSLDTDGSDAWDAEQSLEQAQLLAGASSKVMAVPLKTFRRNVVRGKPLNTLVYLLERAVNVGLTFGVRLLVGDCMVAEGLRRGGLAEDEEGHLREACERVSVADIVILSESTGWSGENSYVEASSAARSRTTRATDRRRHFAQFEDTRVAIETVAAQDVSDIILQHAHACANRDVELNLLREAVRNGQRCPTPWPGIRALRNVIEEINEETEALRDFSRADQAWRQVSQDASDVLADILSRAGFDCACPPFKKPSRFTSFLASGSGPPAMLFHTTRAYRLSGDTSQAAAPDAFALPGSSSWQKPAGARDVWQAVGGDGVGPGASDVATRIDTLETCMNALETEHGRVRPRPTVLEPLRTNLRNQSKTALADVNIIAALQRLLSDRGRACGPVVLERAQTYLHWLLYIRIQCGGDEGVALVLENPEENVAETGTQARPRFKSVRAATAAQREHFPVLQELLQKPWGGAFKAPGSTSHKKGGVKEAVAVLCGIGIAFKTQHSSGGQLDRLEVCSWVVDEVYAFVPRVYSSPERRVQTHLRLAPTRCLLKLINS